ncbi:hypothetical protein Cgig2_030430 [Carnegiea gigantea]|uniref:Uncharacterized protein n=1 Tax=Carnegiea gigantea TaxID=171969 RepID=A0A9Q1KP96_9CARY|nr:hypothetical protein Cgig2_030430 [Carnegiea gigantea]
MDGPSRRTSTTQISGGSGSSRSNFDNNVKYYCSCGYVAVMYGTDDNYRHRYLVCPLEVNCNSFIVNPFIFEPLAVFYNSSATVLTYVFMSLHGRPHLENDLPVNTCHGDPDYPKQARDVIDQLTEELREYTRSVGEEANMSGGPRGSSAMVPLRMSAKHLSRRLGITLVEAHHAASQCEKVHEDYHKNATVMATAKILSLSEC